VRIIAGKQQRISATRKAVLPLFLVSGAVGLIYEVTWTRAFGVVFGNTVFAVSTVLTAFMLGLALGSWLFGRFADKSTRPLLFYALLELFIGTYILVFFHFPHVLSGIDALSEANPVLGWLLIVPRFIAGIDIFSKIDTFYLWFFRSYHPEFYLMSLVRFVISVMVLLVPTALMGATLPVLSKLWAVDRRKESGQSDVGQSVGLLYAINTFGAVAGTFLAGYFLLGLVGVSNTIFIAASANILIGCLALVLYILGGRRLDEKSGSLTSARRGKHRSRRKKELPVESFVSQEPVEKYPVILVAVAVAGFCALALEVLWTRVLVFVLETSAYAFACMLTCFIFGIAIGSFICSRLLLSRIKNPVFALGVVEFLVGLAVLGSVPLLGVLGRIDYMLTPRDSLVSFWKGAAIHFVDALVILFVPTVLMGMVFPIAVRTCAKSWKTAGRKIGDIYASNTVGCVLGSFLAGFVIVPLLGLRDSFLLVIVVQFLLAVFILFFSEKRGVVLGASAAAVSLVLVVGSVFSIDRDVFLQTMNTYHYPSDIVYIEDDVTGTVTVHDLPDGDRLIAVDGVDVAGVDLMLRTTQKLQAYAPLLVHNDPKRVLQIGFGSGETCGIGLAFGVEQYSIVDVCAGVFEAGRFFENINRGSYKNPHLRKIIMDGKNFVKLTDEKFDIIMNDSTYPGTTGSSALYTYDHFVQCRDHLTADGVLSCWVPLDLRPEDFAIIVRSFQAAMPHSSLWMVNNCLNKHAVLMGTMTPMKIDFQRVKNLTERPDISADLQEINIHSVYEFLDCLVVDEKGMRQIGADGPLNTDDEPSLEFGAAIKRDNDGCWIDILTAMSHNHSPVAAYTVNMGQTEQESQQVRDIMDRYFKGTVHALRGLVAMLQGDPDAMNLHFEAAQKTNPEDKDVESCLNELNNEIAALVKAVERTPEQVDLRSRLAKRYLLLRDYERAAEQYASFVELEPDNFAGWNNLGICYNRLDRYDRAIRAFERAIELNPGWIAAYVNLSGVYESREDLTAACRELEKALLVDSSSAAISIYDRLARLYFMQKEYDLALKTLERALASAEGDPDLRKFLENRKELVLRAAETGSRP